jgi:hypothetical protein
MKSAIGPLKRRKRKAILPRLPIKALSSKSRKLSIAQKNYVLDLLADGRRPAEIRDLLREEQGTAVTSQAIAAYVKSNRDEIIKRKKLRAEGMETVHLRYRHARLQEHVRLHAILVHQLFKEMCETCLGQGIVAKAGSPQRCKKCKGHKWVAPDRAKAYELGDDYGLTARSLSNSTPPDGCDLDVWDRLVVNLREIGNLVGDAKVRIAIDAEEQERLAKAQERQALAKQVEEMSPEDFKKLLFRLGSNQGATIVQDIQETDIQE